MKFDFHPEALEEYKDATRYYEGCQSGLGHERVLRVLEYWGQIFNIHTYVTNEDLTL